MGSAETVYDCRVARGGYVVACFGVDDGDCECVCQGFCEGMFFFFFYFLFFIFYFYFYFYFFCLIVLLKLYLQAKDVTVALAVLSIYAVDFSINVGML